MNRSKIDVYTDGAAPNNQNLKKTSPVAWAYIIKGLTPKDIEKSEVYLGRTNDDMELSGYIAAMQRLEKEYPSTLSGYDINVFSDSDYLVKNYNEFLIEWKANGWRKVKNKPLLNLDKWKEIYRLRSAFSASKLSLNHVSAHKTNVDNNRADALAHKAIDDLIASENQAENN